MSFYFKRVLRICLIFNFLIFSFVKADTLDSISLKINDFIYFIDRSITEQIRTDFCIQYFISTSKGEWLESEFRVKFGNKICKGNEEKYLSIINKNRVTVQDEDVPEIVEKENIEKKDNNTKPLMDDGSEDNFVLNDNHIVYWTNIERVKNDSKLSQLVVDPVLVDIAKKRVIDMFENEYFEHVSPSGDSVSKIANRESYKYIMIGENIALGNFGGSRDLVQSWMNSEGHRANILNNNYTNIGVYSKRGEYNGRSVWISAQVFSKPMSYCTEPDDIKKQEISDTNLSLEILKNKIKSVELELKSVSTVNVEEYNKKVTEYNNLAHTFNELISNIKKLTSLYNIEVQKFNECIKVN
jgi:hypothetical protein